MLMVKYRVAFVLITSLAAAPCLAASDQLAVPHVKVTGSTIDAAHTHALAEVLAAARDVYAAWGLNMPEAANLSVTCKEGASADLFNNGKWPRTRPRLRRLVPSGIRVPAPSFRFDVRVGRTD